jgi:hypothetical protein
LVPTTSSRGEHQTVFGGDRGTPQGFLEDVDLAFLAAVGVRDDQPCRERVGFQRSYQPAELFQAVPDGGGDVCHGVGVLGGDVEITAEPADQAVGLYGVAPGECERIVPANGEYVGQQAAVQGGEVHAADRAAEASTGKAFSQTSRRSRLISVRSTGHRLMSRLWLR